MPPRRQSHPAYPATEILFQSASRVLNKKKNNEESSWVVGLVCPLLPLVEAGVVSGVIPGHHEVFEPFVLDCFFFVSFVYVKILLKLGVCVTYLVIVLGVA